ncbi:alpha/beta hydrolase [Asanoa sp. WMMD1127]|uniref:alpha/beta hydrolase n=1 Tax=Asanoa sp. WMMD1127 TaxID=3016107 RepID=UPI002417A636|nr:alpha/beta hydrolase [Asanoa sp. WMMD1127]MDG4826471.1 alpha/beta hydrolase [Asanoa sp. WMMD1127]
MAMLLIHGGLWDDIGADEFWRATGIVARLQRRGVAVCAPDRLVRAVSWSAEADHLAAVLPDARPVTVVAGSNGCSPAVRLALDHPGVVERLVLAWPATAGDPGVDTRIRAGLADLGAAPQVVDALLGGATLRGVTNHELATIRMPVALLPAVPDNPTHQRRTVDALLRILPHAVELPGCPEPPRPEFPPYLEPFCEAVARFATGLPATPL